MAGSLIAHTASTIGGWHCLKQLLWIGLKELRAAVFTAVCIAMSRLRSLASGDSAKRLSRRANRHRLA